MAEQAAEQEPTMEEILASIRRIISEDEEPAEQAPAGRADGKPSRREREAEEPPLRLNGREGNGRELSSRELSSRELNGRAREPEPAPVDEDVTFEEREPEFMRADLAAPDEDGLVSEPVANAAAVAFGELVGQMLVSSRSTEGKTLEDIVRELMKPMLRQWLDANLKTIVEKTVALEVRKIAARAQAR
jgi:cell pole-organizing protein PopZ